MTYRLYICGPMTGLPAENRPAFAAAEASLREAGYDVFNPAAQPDVPGWQTADYLIERDLPALRRCHGVALLDGLHRSFGANIELELADDLDMCYCEVGWWIQWTCEEDFDPRMAQQVARVAALPPETCGFADDGAHMDCGHCIDEPWTHCPYDGRKLRNPY